MELFPYSFFDTKHQLFSHISYVWEILMQIPSYLGKYATGVKNSSLPDLLFLENPEKITIGKGCVIEAGAYIKGPVLIEDNVTIRSGAYIRENAIIGKDCVIGHGTEIKGSILLEEAAAAHFSYVGDSILGKGVNLGAGTKCANVRLDRKNIFVSYQGKKIDTGMHKLGAIIGDGTQVGCNSVISPGTMIAKNSVISPLSNIKGIITESFTHV